VLSVASERSQQLKRISAVTGILLLGFAGGAVVATTLEMHARPVYRDILLSELIYTQESLAGKAERDGDYLRALVHRSNVVTASSTEGLLAFGTAWVSPTVEKEWRFALAAVVLRAIKRHSDPAGIGARRAEGIARGQLALVLEHLDRGDEAQEQWMLAAGLWDTPVERVRRMVERLAAAD